MKINVGLIKRIKEKGKRGFITRNIQGIEVESTDFKEITCSQVRAAIFGVDQDYVVTGWCLSEKEASSE